MEDFSRKFLVEHLKSKDISPSHEEFTSKVQSAILELFGVAKENLKDSDKFKKSCETLSKDIRDRFKKARRNFDRMLCNCPAFFNAIVKKPEILVIKKRSYAKVGAPSKAFEEKSKTGQYIEAKRLKDSASSSKAIFKAAKLAADEEGLKDVSFVYQEVFKNPNTASEFRSSVSNIRLGMYLLIIVQCK